MKAKIGKTYLTEIPHKGGQISFEYPAFKGKYGDVAESIDNAKLKRPTSAQTASLVYDAWQNPKGKTESEIIKILKNRWFWEFTGNLYLPKSNQEIQNGVILENNPKITNGKLDMNKESLVKRLQENDSLVKFVPFGYKTGIQTEFELMKNPYIIERYGQEGAEKIAEIASKYKKQPYLYSFGSVDKEIARMSALGRGWGFGLRLYVGGSWNALTSGLAFRVCKGTEDAE